MNRSDFTRRRHFPGTYGNRFDVVLRLADIIEGLPPILFGALLLAIALPTAIYHTPPFAFILWLFFLGDWAMLEGLPRAGKSFGPAKPPTLALAFLRLLPVLLPLPAALILQFLGTALVIHGFWIEPHRLGLTQQELRSPKLKPGPALRLMHLGDLHVERITDRERQLIEMVRAAEPDLILFSGDFLNLSNLRDPVAWSDLRDVLRQLSAPLGVYVVSGSPAVDLPDVLPQLLDGLPNLRWLRDEQVTLEHAGQPIDLIGLTCTHKPFVDAPRLLDLLPASGRLERFTILLYHTPDLAPDAAAAGIDLQLSGHTHGGQVRLPWYGAIYAGSLYGKRFESGRRTLGDMTLYVTRGIGLEGKGAPRVRFLCPPEVVLWEISGPEREAGDQ